MDLPDGEKYQLDSRTLTIRDIVGSDEGNYTCTFGQETHFAGCLSVYGETRVNCFAIVITYSVFIHRCSRIYGHQWENHGFYNGNSGV